MNERQHEKERRSANALAAAVGGGQDGEMPGKPFQSKLNPHLDEIRTLRRGRKTWQEIADTITVRHGIKTNASSIYEFARRRAKRPAPFGFDDPDETAQLARATTAAKAVEPSTPPADAPGKRVIPPFKKREKTQEEIENEKAWAEIDTSKMPG